MIRFRTETTLQVVEGFDEETDNITEEVEQTFKQSEKVDGDIFNQDGNYCDIQFANGSCAYGVLKDCIEIL